MRAEDDWGFESVAVKEGCISVGLVSTCSCFHLTQKTPEGRKTVKTGPVLCGERPA